MDFPCDSDCPNSWLTSSPSSSSSSPFDNHSGSAMSTPSKPRQKRKSPTAAAVTAACITPSPKKPALSSPSSRKESGLITSKRRSGEKMTVRTRSFNACWAGSLCLAHVPSPNHHHHHHHHSVLSSIRSANTVEDAVLVPRPHTLILGTHPSVKSLAEDQYYAHPLNAFWWIAGDCLGFRRGSGVSPSTGRLYQFTSSLRKNTETDQPYNILSYKEQLETLVISGFALWDIVASCQRPGSLDQDIRDEIPNDIFAFCREHPSVQRIVFANGGTGTQMFVKHFSSWLSSHQLVVADHPPHASAAAALLGKAIQKASKNMGNSSLQDDNNTKQGWSSHSPIALVSAISVSPAAARHSYSCKRDFWEEHVYRPGLLLLQQQRAIEQQQQPATVVTSRYFAKPNECKVVEQT